MCLALVALNAHPRFELVIAANRDEFHARATRAAYWWPEGVLAGRDEIGGGTWLGLTRRGRWSLITNFREGIPRDPNAPSRGELVIRALQDDAAPLACAAAIAREGARYHGFNLLLGERAVAAYTSNRASGAVALSSGLHGLSNHLLDTPWPKLVRSKERLAAWLALGIDAIDPLFELLADRAQADDTALPATGVSRQWERLLSSAFIVNPEYGTRCSTVLTIARDGAARFIEKSFDAAGAMTGEVVQDVQFDR